MNRQYLVKRIGQAVITFWATVTLSFLLYHWMPGGPARAMENMILQNLAQSGETVNMERIQRFVRLYTNIQPDAPLHVQYLNYWESLLIERDLGTSFSKQEPVLELLANRLPWSMFISVYALAIGYSVSILLGSAMAFKEKSRFDSVASSFLTFLQSTPYYVVAILLVYVLAIQNSFLPAGGRIGTEVNAGFNVEFMVSLVTHALLPVLSMSVLGITGALSLRANAIRIIGEDYLRVADLRGLRPSRMATEYVGRNAILPMYTRFMIGIAAVISSSVILEQVFSYPGMGLLMYQAIQIRDYPVLMGSLILFTSITITGILVADLTYGYVDPRATGGAD